MELIKTLAFAFLLLLAVSIPLGIGHYYATQSEEIKKLLTINRELRQQKDTAEYQFQLCRIMLNGK